MPFFWGKRFSRKQNQGSLHFKFTHPEQPLVAIPTFYWMSKFILNTKCSFEKPMKLIYFLIILISINCGLIPNPEKRLDAFLKFIGFRETSSRDTTVIEATVNLTISSTQPKNNTTNVNRNTNIFVGFNKTLSAFDEKNFSILDQNKISHYGKISIKKELGLESDFSSNFTTGTNIDNTPPSIISTSPIEGDKDFPLNAAIIFNFSETIDPTSITSETFTISGGISANRTINEQAANLKPNNNLPELSPYIVTIKVGVKDLAGNKTTSPYSILFSTGSTLVNDNCLYDEGTFGGCLYK